jgi:type II secretion system protein I
MTQRAQSAAGFTLLEALVALGIVATAVISYIGFRTSALIDATRARNCRLAREIAEQKMSELKAGARELQAVSGDEVKLENYVGFSYKVVFGETEVAKLESDIASDASGDDEVAHDRQDWQRGREDYRKAQSRGQSGAEYADTKAADDVNQRLAEKAPSATDFEEAAVAVYFPKLEPAYPGQKDALMIKARLSTLAISCMTPDQAAAIATAKGENAPGAANGQGAPAGGSGGNGGNPAGNSSGSPRGSSSTSPSGSRSSTGNAGSTGSKGNTGGR